MNFLAAGKEGIRIVAFAQPKAEMHGYTSITGNNRRGAATVAAHLLEQGYRRLTFMGGVADTTTSNERETGFIDYLSSQGITVAHRAAGNFERESAREAARCLLSRVARPDAIFCANDDMAVATIEVARYEFGIKPGRELGVAGFDDIDIAAWPSFNLTSYSLPTKALVKETVTVLLDDVIPDQFTRVMVDGELRRRGSTNQT